MVIAKAVAGRLPARIMCQSANRNRVLWLTRTRNFSIEVLLVQQRFGDDAVRAAPRRPWGSLPAGRRSWCKRGHEDVRGGCSAIVLSFSASGGLSSHTWPPAWMSFDQSPFTDLPVFLAGLG
jgi:hypothetical protein